MITESEFDALGRQRYSRIPLVLESFADLDTPLSRYLTLANHHYSYVLDSVVVGASPRILVRKEGTLKPGLTSVDMLRAAEVVQQGPDETV